VIRFSSPAGEGLSMFDNEAIEMIRMMGMSGNVPGAIKAENVEQAIASLKSSTEEAPAPNQSDADEADADKKVGMSTKAFPLIGLLERTAKKGEALMWDHE